MDIKPVQTLSGEDLYRWVEVDTGNGSAIGRLQSYEIRRSSETLSGPLVAELTIQVGTADLRLPLGVGAEVKVYHSRPSSVGRVQG